MKKAFIIFIFFTLFTIPGFSQFVDSFSFMEDSISYTQFIKAIKDNEDESLCLKLYEGLDFSSFDSPKKSVFEIKAKLNYSRYLIENKQKRTAEIILAEAEDELQRLKTDDLFYNILDAETKSLWYLINHFKYLSKAIQSTKLIKKNFISYSNEISAVLQYANALLYTPGKNLEEPLEIFKTLENEKLMAWDQFSLYSGLGMSNFKLKNNKEALLYLSQAKNIYAGDELINTTLIKLT